MKLLFVALRIYVAHFERENLFNTKVYTTYRLLRAINIILVRHNTMVSMTEQICDNRFKYYRMIFKINVEFLKKVVCLQFIL